MGNIIKVKRTTGVPSDGTSILPTLADGELAYIYNSEGYPGALYIGSTSSVNINILQSNVVYSSISNGVATLLDAVNGEEIVPAISVAGEAVIDILPIENGGTNASTVYSARVNMDLISPVFGDTIILNGSVDDSDVSIADSGLKVVYYTQSSQERVMFLSNTEASS